MRKVAEEYGVGCVAAGDWKKKWIKLKSGALLELLMKSWNKKWKTTKKCVHVKERDVSFLWFTQESEKGKDEQLTDNDAVYLVNHAGDGDLEYNNKEPEKADKWVIMREWIQWRMHLLTLNNTDDRYRRPTVRTLAWPCRKEKEGRLVRSRYPKRIKITPSSKNLHYVGY